LSGKKTPGWMDFSQQLAKLTGNYTLLNMVSGIENLSTFLFRTPKWPIGGVYFDGILRTEHMSRIRPTQYPVQTGAVMTDHAVIEPAELTIEVMMSDCHTTSFVSGFAFIDAIWQALQIIKLYSNFVEMEQVGMGDGRSARTWKTLRSMQLSRTPIVVETRLQTYNNMLIEELSAPDDVKTLHAFKCTVRLREIIFAEAAETKVSARAAAATPSSGGQTPATSADTNKSALRAAQDAMGGSG